MLKHRKTLLLGLTPTAILFGYTRSVPEILRQRGVKGQVGYVPVAYLMIIVDETHQEEENDTNRRDGHEKRADGTKIGGEMGQDGERRKKYSAAVIDGIKRKSRIFVGDSIVRKTDSRLNKGEDVVVCLG